jgi:outer membrane protein assembly factor BamB
MSVTGSAWRLALGDIDGDGRNKLVYGAYDGAVACIDPSTGRQLWRAPLGGFPFGVAAGDIDGDRRAEVFAACADGKLYAFGPDGRRCWTFSTGLPLYNVSIGRFGPDNAPAVVCGGTDRKVRVLSGEGKLIAEHDVSLLVHRLAVGDLNGDGADEILVMNGRSRVELLARRGNRLELVWRKSLTVPERMKNWENPQGSFHLMALDLGDLDGDGRPEIAAGDDFHNRQLVKIMRADTSDFWLGTQVPFRTTTDHWSEQYAAAFVRIAGPLPIFGGGRGVIAVAGGLVRLFDARGKLVGQAESRLGFSDLVVDGATLYLGSSPNGDDTVYRIDLSGDWQRAIETLERRGRAAQVGRNLAALREQVLAYRGAAPAGPVYDFRLQLPSGSRRDGPRDQDWFRREFPHANLRHVAQQSVIEANPVLDAAGQPWNPARFKVDAIRGGLTVEAIVARAHQCEASKTPTVFSIGHSCMPFISLDTAEKMLRAAPHYLVGFESSEDEEFRNVPKYLAEFIGPLADLCRGQGGRKVFLTNKGVWWMSMPAQPDVFSSLFTPARRGVIVAKTEDSNSRTPEINLMARVGLRQAGLIDEFAVSVHSDLFSFNRFHQWEYPKSGSPYLRLLVAQAALGGTQYRAYGPLVAMRGEQPALTDYGRESAEIFLHLLGKGLLIPPRPEAMAGLSRVGLAVHAPPEKWLVDGHNGHSPQLWRDDPELNEAILPHNGCTWGNSPTPPHALQAVAFHKQRQFGYFVPPTPYGVIAFVPAQADLPRVAGVEEWWHTDGISLWRDGGPRRTGPAAAEAFRVSLESAAAQLPFRTVGDDVFFQTVQVAPDCYQIYAIDPGWLDPAERRVRVRIQLPGIFAVRDLLSGDALPVTDHQFPLEVPAGSLRILEAVRR